MQPANVSSSYLHLLALSWGHKVNRLHNHFSGKEDHTFTNLSRENTFNRLFRPSHQPTRRVSRLCPEESMPEKIIQQWRSLPWASHTSSAPSVSSPGKCRPGQLPMSPIEKTTTVIQTPHRKDPARILLLCTAVLKHLDKSTF